MSYKGVISYENNPTSKRVTMTFNGKDRYVYSTDSKAVGTINISEHEYHNIVRLSNSGHGVKRYMHKEGIFKRGYTV